MLIFKTPVSSLPVKGLALKLKTLKYLVVLFTDLQKLMDAKFLDVYYIQISNILQLSN